MSSVPTVEFIFLNAAGALVWAAAVGTGGYLFGSALEILIGNIKHYEIQVLGAIATIGVLIWVIYFYRRRKRKQALIKS
jgi:membrane protein DedA with SNARE-associated domain